MLSVLSLFVAATAWDVYDWGHYCQEFAQSSNCLTMCDTRMGNSYTCCESGEWCRCGYCEKVWNSYYTMCTGRWMYMGECADDECCDGSSTFSGTDVCVEAADYFYTSSTLQNEGKALAHDSAWVEGNKMQTSAPEPAKANKALPTILALGGVGVLAVFAAAGLYWRRRKDAAALKFKNLEEPNQQDYQSTDQVEVVAPAEPEKATEMRL